VTDLLALDVAWLPAPVAAWLGTLLRVLAVYAGFLLLERVWPVERGQAARAIWWNVRWWLLYSALSALLVQGALGGFAPAVREALGGPLFALERGGGVLAGVAASLL